MFKLFHPSVTSCCCVHACVCYRSSNTAAVPLKSALNCFYSIAQCVKHQKYDLINVNGVEEGTEKFSRGISAKTRKNAFGKWNPGEWMRLKCELRGMDTV